MVRHLARADAGHAHPRGRRRRHLRAEPALHEPRPRRRGAGVPADPGRPVRSHPALPGLLLPRHRRRRGRRAVRADHRRHRRGWRRSASSTRRRAGRAGQLDAGPRRRGSITWSATDVPDHGPGPRDVHPDAESRSSRRCTPTTASACSATLEEARGERHTGYELTLPARCARTERSARCSAASARERDGRRRGDPADRRRSRTSPPRSELSRELGRVNEELQQVNQLNADVLGVVGHDVRQPLALVLGHLEMLGETCGTTPTSAKLDPGRQGAGRRHAALGPARRHPRDGQLRVRHHRHPAHRGSRWPRWSPTRWPASTAGADVEVRAIG